MGILVLLTTALLLRRNGLALGVFSGLLVLTLLWSLWECGLDFWALTPRLNVVGVLGILMILPYNDPCAFVRFSLSETGARSDTGRRNDRFRWVHAIRSA